MKLELIFTLPIPNINFWVISEFFHYNIAKLYKIPKRGKNVSETKELRRDFILRYFRLGSTFCGVLSEKDILTLPQLTRTLSKEDANCFARSTPYRQLPKSNIKISQITKNLGH